jgi:hypothetical protein
LFIDLFCAQLCSPLEVLLRLFYSGYTNVHGWAIFARTPRVLISDNTGGNHEMTRRIGMPRDNCRVRKYRSELVVGSVMMAALCPDGSAAHPHLRLQTGAACQLCRFRSTSLDLAQRHLARQHQMKSSRGRWLQDGVVRDAMLQSWTQNGQREYWVVQSDSRPESRANQPAGEQSPRRQAQVTAMLQREREHIARMEVAQQASEPADDDLALTTNWMRRTGWAETYAGADRRLLLQLAQLPAPNGHSLALGPVGMGMLESPAEDERMLEAMCQAADHFLRQGEDTARHSDHTTRCWLRSDFSTQPYKAPFEIPGRASTRQRYRILWKRLLCFFARLCRLDDETCEKCLGIQPSRFQREAMAFVWAQFQQEEEIPSHERPRLSRLPHLPLREPDEDQQQVDRGRCGSDPMASSTNDGEHSYASDDGFISSDDGADSDDGTDSDDGDDGHAGNDASDAYTGLTRHGQVQQSGKLAGSGRWWIGPDSARFGQDKRCLP